MAKFIALMLTCLYLTAFSGATVTVHYCAGSAASINFDESYKNKKCNKCQKQKKSCCQTKQTILKINSNHEPSFEHYLVSKTKYYKENKSDNVTISLVKLTLVSYSYVFKNPIESPPIPIYISNCSYRI